MVSQRRSSCSNAMLTDTVGEQGVEIETIKAGDGLNFPKPGGVFLLIHSISETTSLAIDPDKVKMHYTGTLKSNGKKFDSSVDRQVIRYLFSTQIM